jgi:dTDP-4-amino-4,6-dideoxygalactose transaminase
MKDDLFAKYQHYLARKPDEVRSALDRVMASGSFILGSEVIALEQELQSLCGAAGAIAVANGTEAITLALKASGIGPGDWVVVPANTVSASATGVVQAGANLLVADVDVDTCQLSLETLEAALRTRLPGSVRAVLQVHLYGNVVQPDVMKQRCDADGLLYFEDCAQSIGARWRGRPAGSFGAGASLSFYPTKNLGCLGDGGAVLVDSSAKAARVREMRQYGWKERYLSDDWGINSRMDEIQAGILRARLPDLAAENAQRARIASGYLETLRELPLRMMRVPDEAEAVWHQFPVFVEHRDVLREFMLQHRIPVATLYPVPVHHQAGFAGVMRVAAGGCPVAERLCKEVLCLPVFPTLKPDDCQTVVSHMQRFFNI